MQLHRGKWRVRKVIAVAGVASLGIGAAAFAAVVPVEDVDLEAEGGAASFEMEFDYACNDGTSSGGFYHVIEDGTYDDPPPGGGVSSDAYDGAFALFVEDSPFVARNFEGNEQGERLTVHASRRLAGLKVTRFERGLPNTPTFRELVKFKNPKRRAVSRTITLDTELGSDSDTNVRETSNGDGLFNKRDRWGITADANTDPVGDPPVTLVHYGKGAAEKPVRQFGPVDEDRDPEGDGADCVRPQFEIRIGKRQTRYLLFFTEIEEQTADAIDNAQKFNRRHLTPALLNGIGEKTKNRILNWDL